MRLWRQPSELGVAAAALFCCGWGGNQFTPLLAMYRSANGFSEVVVDALLAAYVLGLVPALLIGAGLSDRHGRRRLIIVALLCTGVGSLVISSDVLSGLFLGRLLSGIGIGLAMAVGSTWMVELGTRQGLTASRSARRASLSLTAGLGLGPGVAGLLAQYGPLPASVPYWIHAALTVPILASVVRWGTETSAGVSDARQSRWPRSVADPRFRRLIGPTAPWIFGAAAIAYATVPEALQGRVHSWALLYATILTVAAMAAGFLVQPLAQRLDHPEIPRSLGTAMLVTTVGMALAAATVATQAPWLGVLCAVVLGAALGLTLVSGLSEVQRIASPADLARTTGIFYALAYIGFLVPMLIALSGQTIDALWLLTALAGACGLLIGARTVPALGLLGSRRTSPST